MKVKTLVKVELTLTTFDDETTWVHVSRSEPGRPCRDVYRTEAVEQLSTEELDLALAYLDETAQTVVNRYRRHQLQLWG